MNFTKEINRLNTNSIKWDLMAVEGKPAGTIPMWVADMDFAVPREVKKALKKVVDQEIYGYSFAPDSYYEAVSDWYKSHYNLEFRKENVVTTPGVVTAVGAAVRAFTNEGDAVIIQRPVYYPFSMMIERNDRRVVNSPLINVEGRYIMDIEDFERKIVENNVKLFILCNPHNPVGRVWTKEELSEIAAICERHNVIVVSDEIHCDFVLDGRKHNPFVNVSDKGKSYVVTCTAPSKTFNLAGLQTSNIIIFDKDLREKFQAELDKLSVGMIGPMGIAACEAAYSHGDRWLKKLKKTIEGNRDYMAKFIEDHIPELTMSELEGTYLAWVDMSGLAMTNDELKEFLAKKARIWVDDGDMFGPEGENFARFNLACPLSVVERACKQLEDAVIGKMS